jgi:hypothetical protein
MASRTERHSAQLDHGTSFRPVVRPPAPPVSSAAASIRAEPSGKSKPY